MPKYINNRVYTIVHTTITSHTTNLSFTSSIYPYSNNSVKRRTTIIGEIRHGKHAHAVSTASLKIEQFSSNNHNK